MIDAVFRQDDQLLTGIDPIRRVTDQVAVGPENCFREKAELLSYTEDRVQRLNLIGNDLFPGSRKALRIAQRQ